MSREPTITITLIELLEKTRDEIQGMLLRCNSLCGNQRLTDIGERLVTWLAAIENTFYIANDRDCDVVDELWEEVQQILKGTRA